jgi:hypothetical protein
MKMILHQDITMHLHPVALRAFSQIAQKLPSISIIPKNLFPSISARHEVVDGHRQTQSEEVVTPFSVITLKS